MLPANQIADMEIDGGERKRQASRSTARAAAAGEAAAAAATDRLPAALLLERRMSDWTVRVDDDDAVSQRHEGANASAAANDDGLESCSDEEDTDETKATADGQAAQSELKNLFAYVNDCRDGLFRRTTGWPRKFDGALWDHQSGAAFTQFCWRCPRSKEDGHAFERVVICEGICRRSFHSCCMKSEEAACYDVDPDATWFCHECLFGRFPKPVRSKAQLQAKEHVRLPIGSINRNDPVQRTHLMIAIEEHRLRDWSNSAGADGVVTEPAYLSHLLNAASPAEHNVRSNINQNDVERFTALHYAVRPECLTAWRVTLRLLELGADPRAKATKAENATPLQLAMIRPNPHAVLPLLSDVRTELAPLRFGAVVGQWPGRVEWPLLFVFCVLFVYAEQLIAAKAGVSEASLKQLLTPGPALVEPLVFTLLLKRQPALLGLLRNALKSPAEKKAAVLKAHDELHGQRPPDMDEQAWVVDELFKAFRSDEERLDQSRHKRIQLGMERWTQWRAAFLVLRSLALMFPTQRMAENNASAAATAASSASSSSRKRKPASGGAAAGSSDGGQGGWASPTAAVVSAAAAASASASVFHTAAGPSGFDSSPILPRRINVQVPMSSFVEDEHKSPDANESKRQRIGPLEHGPAPMNDVVPRRIEYRELFLGR
jgi:hypothetical protein